MGAARARRLEEAQQEKRLRARDVFKGKIKNGSLDLKLIFFAGENSFSVGAK